MADARCARLAAAALVAFAATPALAQQAPAEVQPPGSGIMDDPCPPQQGLWFAHPYILANDWAWLCRYRADNQRLMQQGVRPDVVFIGDSITEGWRSQDPAWFGSERVNRGIGGQTSPQMLVRFMADVVALRPRAVHIMIGTNDIAGNTGPTTMIALQDNIRAAVAIARANNILVILGSVAPSDEFSWRPTLRPAETIASFDAWLRNYAQEQRLTYADYYSALVVESGGIDPRYSGDKVHPNAAGYAVMRPIAERAIARALRRR